MEITQSNLWLAIICLFGISVILFLMWRRAVKILKKEKFSKKSLSSKYGKMSEQFMPFLSIFPYNSQNFRFLGSPVDGVQFENDKIIFMEFKSAGSGLSPRQKEIKGIIAKKQIYFEEFRIKN
ncbi:endonuclease [Candidatus Berkelbacteria bacterium CG_4_9_14_3_um_filter_39_23]|uniref:Endonuclease n=2 Tax=Candidatus Berkelbacteria TaxID=1618330 RepID=A0A2M7CJ24_9BACT|nr:endonuclease [Candidatus Berkelbacteria bacterium]PIR27904.1 MAG: endonuclease [Candidatus Berkelbacteria bacterium CG11_big_fil_rev_8_21_14_0_20_40_23]PIV25651.1 MAG: endonuclease [Candidatus Berkelbacteria bacterium CG03_land_8_20_14_0_80_40_36]PIX30694.1 MAG: endonuclease [Candidatus Berkelbacteria bacterium CG_4_8_14_3_um_filter_39_27]PIZ28630.1 MAG: endonuclease [Candidatus Berkelbacteria bacterium CG_4_10_14_0_8_um_filter_39_42]PJB50834.1 MAG: endonuclease [Candidatus Berkelbacteria b